MAVTLANIKTNIRLKIGRGTALDASLDNLCQQAVRHIERKLNWPFMYNLRELVSDPEDATPRVLSTSSYKIREIDYMRITEESSETITPFKVLNKCIDPSVWSPPLEGYPTEYFLKSETAILLDNTPELVYTFDCGWWEYTTLATGDSTEHWFFDNAQDLIEDLATYYAAKNYRDFQRAALIMQTLSPVLDDLVGSAEDKLLGDAELVMRRDFYSELQG